MKVPFIPKTIGHSLHHLYLIVDPLRFPGRYGAVVPRKNVGSISDTVPKTCVSSKVLIFVVTLRIKSRTMELTSEQRSEIISEMASSEASFNELMRVLLDSFSKQERALFLEEHKGE